MVCLLKVVFDIPLVKKNNTDAKSWWMLLGSSAGLMWHSFLMLSKSYRQLLAAVAKVQSLWQFLKWGFSVVVFRDNLVLSQIASWGISLILADLRRLGGHAPHAPRHFGFAPHCLAAHGRLGGSRCGCFGRPNRVRFYKREAFPPQDADAGQPTFFC